MYKGPSAWDRINSFALVSYIPEPLAGFLDRLRQELVPNCFLRAHVTILPPRPILSSPEEAWEVIRGAAPEFLPFEVELAGVDVFPVSDVIYIQVSAGSVELQRMHAALKRSLPHLSRSEIFWRMKFTYGALHHWLLTKDKFRPDWMEDVDVETQTQKLISFAAAGFRAA